jgi:PhnO protein
VDLMILVRDYKPQDLQNTLNLMSIFSNVLDIELNEDTWKHIAKLRAFDPQFRTFIAEDNGIVVGMCFADIQRNETGRFHGLIRNVIVDPKFRKKGIASKLITEAINFFAELKVDSIKVQVLEEIKEVIHIFEIFNFKCTAVVMEKDVLKIREYKDSDYDAATELMRMYSDLINEPFNEHEWKQTIRIRMVNPQYRILISECGKEVSGMAFVSIDSDETGIIIGYIDNILVHKKYRGQGYGRALLSRAIEILNVLNVDKIRVMAHLEVKNDLQVFENVGFRKAAYMMEIKLPHD